MPDLRRNVPVRASTVSLVFGLLADAVVAFLNIFANPSLGAEYEGMLSGLIGPFLVLVSFGCFAVLATAASLLAWPLATWLVDVARPDQLVGISALAGLAVLIGAVPSALLGSVVAVAAGDTRMPALVVIVTALSGLVTALAVYAHLRRATAVWRRSSAAAG